MTVITEYCFSVGNHRHVVVGKQIITNSTVNATSIGPTPTVPLTLNRSSTKNTTNYVTTSQTDFDESSTDISWIAGPISCFCILLFYAFTCAIGLCCYHKNEDHLCLGTLCCPCYTMHLTHKFGSYCYGSNEKYMDRCLGTNCCPCYTLYKCGPCETNESIL